MRPRKLRYALQSLYEEAAQFRFDYPLRVVPEAGPKESLHYYLHKYRPTPNYRSVMRLDANGVPQVWARITGVVYKPAFIAMYGLANLGRYLRQGNPAHLGIFLKQVDWLERNAVLREDGAVVWQHNFDVQEGPAFVRAPWVSANVQGFVMSALVRAWRITARPRLLDLLNRSVRVFELDCRDNGVREQAEGHILYSEVPGVPAPGIMDGFMRSLLGLYDLYVETGDARVYDLFAQGLEGLRYFLPRWDYRKKWTFYANGDYLCSPAYHSLNRMLLSVLARLTNDRGFEEYVSAWNPDRLSRLERVEIYSAFLLTKNASRWKYRTWRQESVPDST